MKSLKYEQDILKTSFVFSAVNLLAFKLDYRFSINHKPECVKHNTLIDIFEVLSEADH